MKLNSKYFDSIRVSSKGPAKPPEERHPPCQWEGCDKKGAHRAPMGRGKDGKYYRFCVDHVRQYNASYNYFDGMSDTEVAAFLKDSATGHRPTWKVAANSAMPGTKPPNVPPEAAADPHAFFAWRAKNAREEAPERRRKLKPLERKSITVLNLSETASKEEIKTKFKELVKLHHPDANGGDSRSEEKLREIIQAYNYLKQAGLA